MASYYVRSLNSQQKTPPNIEVWPESLEPFDNIHLVSAYTQAAASFPDVSLAAKGVDAQGRKGRGKENPVSAGISHGIGVATEEKQKLLF